MNPKHYILRILCLCIISLGILSCKNSEKQQELATAEKPEDNSWKKADEIIKNIKVPQFPDAVFNVMDYGAKADVSFNNSKAFADAITDCHENGGGKVVVPTGRYLTGPIHLKSNVNFHLEEGTEILFSTEKKDYLPVVHTSYEGMELMNYSPLIYAYKQKNIAVTGKGIFNGQANEKNWWPWSSAERYGYIKGEKKSTG